MKRIEENRHEDEEDDEEEEEEEEERLTCDCFLINAIDCALVLGLDVSPCPCTCHAATRGVDESLPG